MQIGACLLLYGRDSWKESDIARILTAVALAFAAAAQTPAGRPLVAHSGSAADVVVDLAGGSIVSFHLKEGGLNPLQWESPGGATEPRPRGHFVCLDRWGAPSEAEARNGMPFHGEASRVRWELLGGPEPSGGWIASRTAAALPLAGLAVERVLAVSETASAFRVTERVTNRNKLGRVWNLVQHPTIGPPFLDAGTVVDCNAGTGFMQSSPLPNPEEPAVHWPQALRRGTPVDLRHLAEDPSPNVVSYTIDEPFGWVTAASAARGLLIGYVWKTSEYPWLNLWRHVADGKPAARGLEFGTTGLHQPYPVLVRKGRIFGRPLYEHLDAGETASKSYGAFLVRVPPDYRGTARVEYRGDRVVVTERGPGTARTFEIAAAGLLP